MKIHKRTASMLALATCFAASSAMAYNFTLKNTTEYTLDFCSYADQSQTTLLYETKCLPENTCSISLDNVKAVSFHPYDDAGNPVPHDTTGIISNIVFDYSPRWKCYIKQDMFYQSYVECNPGS